HADDARIDELRVARVPGEPAREPATERGREAAPEDDEVEQRLRERRDEAHAVAPEPDHVAPPDDVDAANEPAHAQSGRRERRGPCCCGGHRRPPPRMWTRMNCRIMSAEPAPSSRIACPVSLRKTSSRLGRRSVTVLSGTVSSRTSCGRNVAPSGTSM